MNPPRFVGIQPRFPWFLNGWTWLTTPVPAERMAALRIAVALALLLDLVFGCLPYFASYGLGLKEGFPWRFRDGHYYWSILRWLPDPFFAPLVSAIWFASFVALLVGYRTFISGIVAWVCAVSFWNINPWVANGGDQMRNFLLLLIACSRGGAVWGVQSVRREHGPGPVCVPGWPLKLLWVYLCCMYFFSGICKMQSPAWRSGFAMVNVNENLAWSMAPSLTGALPELVHRLSAWITLIFELGFPLFIAYHRTRAFALILGIIFHIVSFFTLEIGAFALYSLACYAAFVPWEKGFGFRRRVIN